MKKIIFFVFIVAFSLSVNFAFAQALMPLGGRILTAPTPGVSCPAGRQPESPFTITPIVATIPPGLYIGDYNPTSLQFNLTPGSWILGLYLPVPIPECATQTGTPAPVSGLRTIIHGTSSYLPI